MKPLRTAALLIAVLGWHGPTVVTAQSPVLDLLCDADDTNPFDPNDNVPGPYRPKQVTFRVDFSAGRVEMREGETLHASATGVVATERTIKWGYGSRGLDTWERQGLSRRSQFDGTIDRIAGHAVVVWYRGQGRWQYTGFAGRCRLAPEQPKF